MITLEQVSLARQVDMAFEELEGELKGMSAGTIVLQVRNDELGKFGIRHLPLLCGQAVKQTEGMSAEHVRDIRRRAVEALQFKRGWTHGEIAYDFTVRQGQLTVSVQFESNYNMANLLIKLGSKRREDRDMTNK